MTKRLNIKYNYYSDKLAHVQVVINCQNIDAQMCTHEDGLAYNTGAPSIDDVMSYSSLTTNLLTVYGIKYPLVNISICAFYHNIKYDQLKKIRLEWWNIIFWFQIQVFVMFLHF